MGYMSLTKKCMVDNDIELTKNTTISLKNQTFREKLKYALFEITNACE